MNRVSDYDQVNQDIQSDCDNDVALKEARAEIFKELIESVKVIKSHRYDEDSSVAIKAAKEHLTLAGLYVERHEYSGIIKVTELELDL